MSYSFHSKRLVSNPNSSNNETAILSNMASTETCQLNETHPPKERSIEVFSAVLPEIKSQLLSLRHLHPPAYFDAVKDLSNNDLTSFTVDNLESVRVGTTAVRPLPRH